MTLREALLRATADYLRGGSVLIVNSHGMPLAEVPITDMQPQGNDLEIVCGPAVISQSGFAAQATLHASDGVPVHVFPIGPGHEDLTLDSHTLVRGDRIELTLWGV